MKQTNCCLNILKPLKKLEKVIMINITILKKMGENAFGYTTLNIRID
jgi:hypothetical protein